MTTQPFESLDEQKQLIALRAAEEEANRTQEELEKIGKDVDKNWYFLKNLGTEYANSRDKMREAELREKYGDEKTEEVIAKAKAWNEATDQQWAITETAKSSDYKSVRDVAYKHTDKAISDITSQMKIKPGRLGEWLKSLEARPVDVESGSTTGQILVNNHSQDFLATHHLVETQGGFGMKKNELGGYILTDHANALIKREAMLRKEGGFKPSLTA